MAVNQTLEVVEVAGSASTTANTSKVRILWKSTQTGESWNGYTRTAKYYVSINGGAEAEYSAAYTLPKGSTKTIVDKTITVAHNSDGGGTVKVRTWMDTDISAGVVQLSKSLDLDRIARASVITSAVAVTLGNKCSVKWTPLSADFRYKLKFTLGSWSHTTGAIHPKTTSVYHYTGYAIALAAAAQIPNASSGTMTVELYTYSDSGATAQVGEASSKTFAVTVPENTSTKPTVQMELSSVSSLPTSFAGLYIQGKSRVKADLTCTGKYGATIEADSMTVNGTTYGSSAGYTSGYLAKYGEFAVTGTAKDSRGFTGTTTEKISVVPYGKPKILPVDGETEVIAARCDADGNVVDDGTYLKIKAKRSYSPVNSGNVQKNFCRIQYRYKAAFAAAYSAWTTILGGNEAGNQVETGALLGGVLNVTTSYLVQVRAVDDIGESSETTIPVSTEKVYAHRTKNALGLGKYVEGENLLDCAWDAHFYGEVRIGGVTLDEYILAVISKGE